MLSDLVLFISVFSSFSCHCVTLFCETKTLKTQHTHTHKQTKHAYNTAPMDDETMPHTSSAGSGNRSPSPSTLRMLRLRSLSSLSDQLSEQKEVKAQEGTLNEALNEERKAGIFYDRGQERENGQEQGQGGVQQGGKGGDGLPTLIPPELPNLSQDLKVSEILGVAVSYEAVVASPLTSSYSPSLSPSSTPSLPPTSTQR